MKQREQIARELLHIAKTMLAKPRKADMSSMVWGFKKDVEFAVDIVEGRLEIGMGGEWWGGPFKIGKNVFRHRKEGVDPAYAPVTVQVTKQGHSMQFAVMGGFYGSPGYGVPGTVFTMSIG